MANISDKVFTMDIPGVCPECRDNDMADHDGDTWYCYRCDRVEDGIHVVRTLIPFSEAFPEDLA